MKRSRKIILGVVIVTLVAVIAAVVYRARQPAPIETITPERKRVAQEVDFSGRVEAAQAAELAFEVSGTVAAVEVAVGDTVAAGQQLATLDSRTQQLEVAKARADRLSSVHANELDLAAAEETRTNTEAVGKQTLARLQQTVRDAKAEMDSAQAIWEQTVRESGEESSTTRTKYGLLLSARSAYRAAQRALAENTATVEKNNDTARAAAETARAEYLSTIQSSGKTAGLSSLQAGEQLAAVRLSKQTLTAPFAGVVTQRQIDVGELATAGEPALTVETTTDVKISAQVIETDAAKLRVGQPAMVRLDVVQDGQTWPATVVSIDPTATLVEGVPTYTVTVVLTNPDPAFRPGLTAEVVVQIKVKDNVLTVPRRAVKTVNGQSTVSVLVGPEEIVEKPVVTGLTGSVGEIEIIEGLAETDKVVVRPPQTR